MRRYEINTVILQGTEEHNFFYKTTLTTYVFVFKLFNNLSITFKRRDKLYAVNIVLTRTYNT